MDFGEILSRAWRIVWKYKILWVFGIFAGLVSQASTGAGNRSFGSSGIRYSFDMGDFSSGRWPAFMQDFGYNIERYFRDMPVWFWLVLGVSLFILAIGFWLLSIYGRAGLVHGASDGDEDAPMTFGGLFGKASHYFGRLFLFDLLIFVGGLVLTVGIGLALVTFGVLTLGIGLLCLVPLLCLAIPVGWVLAIYLTQVQVALVSEDLGVWEAFARAWKLVTSRLGEMVVMGLILFVIRLAAGIVLALPFGLVAAPFAASLLTTGGVTTTALTASLVIGLVLLPFAILGGGILEAYQLSAWTLTFRRLSGHKAGLPAVVEPAAPIAPVAPVAPEAPSAPEAPLDPPSQA